MGAPLATPAAALRAGPAHAEETGGTNRFWRFSVDEWLSFQLPLQLEWEFLEASPFNPVSSSRGR